jgi:hypothetical protein
LLHRFLSVFATKVPQIGGSARRFSAATQAFETGSPAVLILQGRRLMISHPYSAARSTAASEFAAIRSAAVVLRRQDRRLHPSGETLP